MKPIDRMGGFVAVKVIDVKFIESFRVLNNKASITLKPGHDYFSISHKKNGISPNISSASDKSGELFSIDLQIAVKNETNLKFIPFNRFIVVCQNPLGNEYVFGTKEYPMTGSKRPVLSGSASGSMGEMVTFSGKQTNYPYILLP